MIFILLALAVAPGLAIALFIYERDKLDKEPLHLLVKSFFLGVISVIPAILFEFMAKVIGFDSSATNANMLNTGFYALFVASIEELAKYACLIWFAYPRKEFDEPFDGIIYATMIAMGFATFENIFYVIDGGISVGLWRMFSAVPAHATFGILMGYFVGMAKFKHQGFASPLKIAGLVTAILFHTAYDFCLFVNNSPLLFIGAFLSLFIGIGLSLRAIHLHNRNSPFHSPQDHLKKKQQV